ncbi:hypothetical protein M1L21_40025 [Streptomyces sp. AS02]|nr:hypothetical protein [Streptomyces sp. AS02]MCL8017242.1 hypothetical protein [Streptomyces sp. AS02]
MFATYTCAPPVVLCAKSKTYGPTPTLEVARALVSAKPFGSMIMPNETAWVSDHVAYEDGIASE